MSEIERFRQAYDDAQPIVDGHAVPRALVQYLHPTCPAFLRLIREIIERLPEDE